MSKKDLMALQHTQKVRIKDSVDCHTMYHEGGFLTFQSQKEADKGDQLFGIKTDKGVCFEFKAEDYELITE